MKGLAVGDTPPTLYMFIYFEALIFYVLEALPAMQPQFRVEAPSWIGLPTMANEHHLSENNAAMIVASITTA